MRLARGLPVPLDAEPVKEPAQRSGGRRRLTNQQVSEIVHKRVHKGWTAGKIAYYMNVPESQVQGVINGNGARTIA